MNPLADTDRVRPVRSAPRRAGLWNDLIIGADRFDRIVSFAKTCGVLLRGNIIETGAIKRPFGGEIQFVADEPNSAPGRVGDEIFDPQRKSVVLGADRDGAIGKIAVVDATNDGMAGVGEGIEIDAGKIVGIGADGDGRGDPGAGAGGVGDLGQEFGRVRIVIVDAVEIRRFGGETTQSRQQ